MLTQPMDPEKKSLNFIFPTKYVIPKSLSRLAIGWVRMAYKFGGWSDHHLRYLGANAPSRVSGWKLVTS